MMYDGDPLARAANGAYLDPDIRRGAVEEGVVGYDSTPDSPFGNPGFSDGISDLDFSGETADKRHRPAPVDVGTTALNSAFR